MKRVSQENAKRFSRENVKRDATRTGLSRRRLVAAAGLVSLLVATPRLAPSTVVGDPNLAGTPISPAIPVSLATRMPPLPTPLAGAIWRKCADCSVREPTQTHPWAME